MDYRQCRDEYIRRRDRGKKKKFIICTSTTIFMCILVVFIAVISSKINNKEDVEAATNIQYFFPQMENFANAVSISKEVEIPKFIGEYETPAFYFLKEQVEPQEITAEYAVLYDVNSSTVLYEKAGNEKCYPASLTKLLTAAVTMNVCKDKNIVFEVGDELAFVEPDASSAYLIKGEKLTVEMLIDALLLPSGGDAAYVLAVNVGRFYAQDENLSKEEALEIFVELMNITAQEIGAVNSHFMNPDGYHDPEHYTTAVDMVKISLYALSFPTVAESAGKTYAKYTIISGEEHTWYNSNYMLAQNSQYYYYKAEGLKTGYTDQAGQCISVYAVDGDDKLISVIFKAVGKANRFGDAQILLEAGFDYLS